MWRTLWLAGTGALCTFLLGCATGARLDQSPILNPSLLAAEEQNPLFIERGRWQDSYGHVFESALKVLIAHGFDIHEMSRYDGRIESNPRTSPGLGLFFLAGSTDPAERLLSTLQSYRHRASVVIQPAENSGFFIQVIVYRELEDLPRPTRATAGAVLYNRQNSVDRQFEVVDPTVYETTWIPKGRDAHIEQSILRSLRACLQGDAQR